MIFRSLFPHEWPWVAERFKIEHTSLARDIAAVRDDGTISAIAVFDYWTANSGFITVIVDDRRVYRAGFIEECARYFFDTCGKDILLARISSKNTLSLKSCNHLGFKQFATVPNAYAEGDDMQLFSLTKADCKWLEPVFERKAA